MRARPLVITLALVISVAAGAVAQTPAAGSREFKRSDPNTLNTSGRLQLVEFYHPT
jgi:hypothetical protein